MRSTTSPSPFRVRASEVPALAERATAAWEAGDHENALQMFMACAAKDPSWGLNVGYFFDEGVGRPTDKAAAMGWYKQAYRAGSGSAASNIAILYRERGFHRLARQWFDRAVKLNDGDAHVELAKVHLSGTGARRSKIKAKEELVSAVACWERPASGRVTITQAGYEEAQALLSTLEN